MPKLDFLITKQSFEILSDEENLFNIKFLNNVVNNEIADNAVVFLVQNNIRPVIYMHNSDIELLFTQITPLFCQIGIQFDKVKNITKLMSNNYLLDIDNKLKIYLYIFNGTVNNITNNIMLLDMPNNDIKLIFSLQNHPEYIENFSENIEEIIEEKDINYQQNNILDKIIKSFNTSQDFQYLSFDNITTKNKYSSYLVSRGRMSPQFIIEFYDSSILDTDSAATIITKFNTATYRPLYEQYPIISTIPAIYTSITDKSYIYYNEGENYNSVNIDLKITTDTVIENSSVVGETSKIAFLTVFDKQNLNTPLYYIDLKLIQADNEQTIYYGKLSVNPETFFEGKLIFSVVLKQKIIDSLPFCFTVTDSITAEYSDNIINIFSMNSPISRPYTPIGKNNLMYNNTDDISSNNKPKKRGRKSKK
jgi:hypothetical protein